ncbi:hypothetical protein [Crenobacter intestini]|uniref:Uncharacterized protein n=1 Tax=Crenobacter intestini TaxID=2563443 RepID=A0A4T0UNE7_9NEIS|nr:hypothetical protein [Crenobacter intestini]TIC80294.1 hypothetical protein E5K04_12365 [Crenobacter intestini]
MDTGYYASLIAHCHALWLTARFYEEATHKCCYGVMHIPILDKRERTRLHIFWEFGPNLTDCALLPAQFNQDNFHHSKIRQALPDVRFGHTPHVTLVTIEPEPPIITDREVVIWTPPKPEHASEECGRSIVDALGRNRKGVVSSDRLTALVLDTYPIANIDGDWIEAAKKLHFLSPISQAEYIKHLRRIINT